MIFEIFITPLYFCPQKNILPKKKRLLLRILEANMLTCKGRKPKNRLKKDNRNESTYIYIGIRNWVQTYIYV